MKLNDVDVLQLLPKFMRTNEANKALAAAVGLLVRSAGRSIAPLRVWDQIDYMDDQQLDTLAWELNVLWYDAAASVETKRRLILNSDNVYTKLGTKWAVEEVVTAYLGDALVSEWWEYDGQPHHFKVISNNPLIGAELENIFIRALDKVKRKSQWLDAVVVSLEAAGTVFAGFVAQDISTDVITITDHIREMSPPELSEFSGVGFIETTTETIAFTERMN